jgi:hypothetical protein
MVRVSTRAAIDVAITSKIASTSSCVAKTVVAKATTCVARAPTEEIAATSSEKC